MLTGCLVSGGVEVNRGVLVIVGGDADRGMAIGQCLNVNSEALFNGGAVVLRWFSILL